MKLLFTLLLMLAGASSIMLAVEAFKAGKYFWFGLDVMWVVLDTILITVNLINLQF